jgi:hypothetical protein
MPEKRALLEANVRSFCLSCWVLDVHGTALHQAMDGWPLHDSICLASCAIKLFCLTSWAWATELLLFWHEQSA